MRGVCFRAPQLLLGWATRTMDSTSRFLAKRTRRGLALRIRRLLRLRRLYLIRAELRWIPNQSQRLLVLTVGIGVVCGLAAVAFHLAIQIAERLFIERATGAPGRSWMVWTIAVPAVGAAVCGLALQYLVPNARGSGIPQVKVAFAGKSEPPRLRDAVGKFVIGALQIGTGSSLGREGPTVQLCAGIASTLGRALGVSPKNVRRLIPVGAAAGIAAAFNAPIAAVTFTVEEVLGSLDQTMLSGVIAAAALAAVIERGILGEATSINEVYSFSHLQSLLVCLAIGLAAAYVSVGFSQLLLRLRGFFRSLTMIPEWLRPAFGGMVTGTLAVVALATLNARGITGGGYTTLGEALNGALSLRVMLLLCVMKTVATAFSYSSGGAGGIFAPTLFVGAMLGGSMGALADGSGDPVGAFALVGMGAVFAGVVRAPMTSVLIVVEMTGSYGLILPLMIANLTSYALARRCSPLPIYEALLDQDGIRLPARVAPDSLETLPVSSALGRHANTLDFTASMRSEELLRIWHEHRPQEVYSVVNQDRQLTGIITVDDLTLLVSEPGLVTLTNATDLMRPAISVSPDDSLQVALDMMVANGIREIPVTDRAGALLGWIDDSAIAAALLRTRSGTSESVASANPSQNPPSKGQDADVD